MQVTVIRITYVMRLGSFIIIFINKFHQSQSDVNQLFSFAAVIRAALSIRIEMAGKSQRSQRYTMANTECE